MMTVTITRDEWLAELERLADTPDDDGYMTVDEIARELDRTKRWVLAKLKELQHDGRLLVSRKASPALDGRTFHVPAYKVKA